MFDDRGLIWTAVVIVALNVTIAILFWLHEKLENSKVVRLRQAVEQVVRAVEQVCGDLDNAQKKEAAVTRVQAFLGFYRWFIPSLVIDSAIEAEIFVIRQLHKRLSVDHDAPDEVIRDESGN